MESSFSVSSLPHSTIYHSPRAEKGAIITTLSALVVSAVAGVFAAAQLEIISLGAPSAVVAALPLILPIALCALGGTVALISIIFLLIKGYKNKQELALLEHGKACWFGAEAIPKNKKEAFDAFQKAAKFGSASSKIYLGICYATGKGCLEDKEKAFTLFKMAAEQNDPLGMYFLAKCYLEGIGCDQNVHLAADIMKKAAAMGEPRALFAFSEHHVLSVYVESEESKICRDEQLLMLKEAAAKDFIPAQLFLAHYYQWTASETIAIENLEMDLKQAKKLALELYTKVSVSNSTDKNEITSMFYGEKNQIKICIEDALSTKADLENGDVLIEPENKKVQDDPKKAPKINSDEALPSSPPLEVEDRSVKMPQPTGKGFRNRILCKTINVCALQDRWSNQANNLALDYIENASQQSFWEAKGMPEIYTPKMSAIRDYQVPVIHEMNEHKTLDDFIAAAVAKFSIKEQLGQGVCFGACLLLIKQFLTSSVQSEEDLVRLVEPYKIGFPKEAFALMQLQNAFKFNKGVYLEEVNANVIKIRKQTYEKMSVKQTKKNTENPDKFNPSKFSHKAKCIVKRIVYAMNEFAYISPLSAMMNLKVKCDVNHYKQNTVLLSSTNKKDNRLNGLSNGYYMLTTPIHPAAHALIYIKKEFGSYLLDPNYGLIKLEKENPAQEIAEIFNEAYPKVEEDPIAKDYGNKRYLLFSEFENL